MAHNQRRALITGITGKGYQVFGLIRGQNNPKRELIEKELPGIELVEGDLTDMSSLVNALEISQPHEVYNLAAISFVAFSFKQPEVTGNVTGLGALRLLEAIRLLDSQSHKIKFYQASTSELFGKVRETPQTELTPFHPRSPYGVAKAYAHYMTVNYRESYGIHASCGILFNHESPRRGYEFITRKVTSGVARIKLGLQRDLALGNLDAKRDWGFAGDYVRAMWLMLQQPEPDDYVIATGKTHSIKELLSLAFAEAGIKDWKPYVKQDPRFMRPAEVDVLLGDPTRAEQRLSWKREVDFPQLVAMMVQNDLEIEGAKLAN